MNENTAPTATVTETPKKKRSSYSFEYTGKDFAVKNKENPAGLHKAAIAWLNVLKAAGKSLTQAECLSELGKLTKADTGTTQEPIRIIYYWKKALVEGGWIRPLKKLGTVAISAPAETAAEAAETTEA